MVKKILVTKNQTATSVVEEIVAVPEEEIVLVIPKHTALRNSVSNFHLIKKEAAAAKKTVTVESVDEEVLALAKASRLEATHPLFSGVRPTSSFSDIVVRRNVPQEKSAPLPLQRENRYKEKTEEVSPMAEARESEETHPRVRYRKTRVRLRPGVIAGVLIPVVVFGGAFWLMSTVWSHADIVIHLTKSVWDYEGAFRADTALAKIAPRENALPGELFTQNKNVTQLFPASGKSTVAVKATGEITVVNAYSSSPQVLVATTRFMAPDGKIFRIENQVVIPGAQVKNGQIVPATIQAAIIAAEPGPTYNVGPVAHLTIPGFRGSPKYQGFYGVLSQPTTGGFVGEKAVPTPQDVADAKAKTTTILTTALTSLFMRSQPAGFTILDGASQTHITKLTVNETTDTQGNFSVFGEATFQALGFREADLKTLLLSLAAGGNSALVFNSLSLDYRNVTSDFEHGRLSFTATAHGALQTAFSPDDFKNRVAGQDVNSARSLILTLPGLSDAKVSLWPFWLRRVPSDPQRVRVVVD